MVSYKVYILNAAILFAMGFVAGFTLCELVLDFIPAFKDSVKAEYWQNKCDSLLDVNDELRLANCELRDSLITLKYKEE